MIRKMALIGGFCSLYCNTVAADSDGNCLLEQCDTEKGDTNTDTSTHPTEHSVLGTPLQVCSKAPMTGFYRDGYCRTGVNDRGIHVVCAEMTAEFLTYTKAKGNDLSKPSPQYGFPGLNPGDKWCLCSARWAEANSASVAPDVVLEATSKAALDSIALPTLQGVSPKK